LSALLVLMTQRRERDDAGGILDPAAGSGAAERLVEPHDRTDQRRRAVTGDLAAEVPDAATFPTIRLAKTVRSPCCECRRRLCSDGSFGGVRREDGIDDECASGVRQCPVIVARRGLSGEGDMVGHEHSGVADAAAGRGGGGAVLKRDPSHARPAADGDVEDAEAGCRGARLMIVDGPPTGAMSPVTSGRAVVSR
jgi:hypothetical protein